MSAALVRKLAALAVLTGAAAGGTSAAAAGFYLQEQSARAIGRAFSGEEADTGVQSLWWNPAAVAGETHAEAYLGMSAILPGTNVSDHGTLIVRPGQAPTSVGGVAGSNKNLLPGALPSGAFALPINDKIAFGLALTAPFDFTTKYGGRSWARYSATTTSLRTIDVQPSIAFAPTSWFRIGVGPNAEHADAILANALPNLSPLLPDGAERLTGSGWDWGWSAGAQLHNDVATVGVSYKSSIDHHLDGHLGVTGLLGPLAASNIYASSSAEFRTPWQVIVGARYKVTKQLTLDLQGARVGWGEFSALKVGAPANVAIPEDYRDTWSIAGGFDYDIDPQWTARAGVQYDQTPTRDGERDPRVPDSDRVNLAVGGSYHATAHLSFDAGLSYVMFMKEPIDKPTAAYLGSPAQTFILTDGALTDSHVVVLSLGAQLGF